jgi:hypothetical protein
VTEPRPWYRRAWTWIAVAVVSVASVVLSILAVRRRPDIADSGPPAPPDGRDEADADRKADDDLAASQAGLQDAADEDDRDEQVRKLIDEGKTWDP